MRRPVGWSRRSGPSLAAIGTTAALLLAACAGPSGVSDDPDLLRVVMLGSENETLDYGSAQSYFPLTVIGNTCDSLVANRDGETTYSLAETVTPNADADEWTITIRDDAVFHDGGPVTAQDVVESLRYFAASPGFAGYYEAVDVDALTAVDTTTVRVPLTEPRADFVETVLSSASVVFDDGDGATATPSCSGPFVLEGFDPGTGTAVLARNAEHWAGAPPLERLEIRRVADPTARVNALISGEADFAFDIPGTGASTVSGRDDLTVLAGGVENSNAMYFALNTRVAPFDDPAVRRAMMLAVDREQLATVVLGEYGQIGNDLFGKGLDGYAGAIEQRGRDVAAARAALSAAGVTELTATVAELTPGLRDAADLLGQQLAEVGVQLTVEQIDPSSFFTDLERLHSSQIISQFALNLSPVATLPNQFGVDNPYAYAGWNPDEFTALVAQMRRTVDDAQRQAVVDRLQQLQWEQGAYLVWGYREQLSAARGGLDGVRTTLGYPLFSEARFR